MDISIRSQLIRTRLYCVKFRSLVHPIYFVIVYFGGFLDVSGWRISDESIHAGLEHAYLLGRSQFLTSTEAETLGLPGATIMLDGGLIQILALLHVPMCECNNCA